MDYLGADISRPVADGGTTSHTVVSLRDDGRLARVDHVATLPAVAATVGTLAGDDPFLLGVNLPIVVPALLNCDWKAEILPVCTLFKLAQAELA